MTVEDAARAAGMLTNPSGTERLHQYWVHGEGAAKIRWGSPGDYDRCVLHLSKYLRDAHGYCADAHHAALGIWPATHAKEIKAGRSAPVADKKPYGNVTYADPRNGKYPLDSEKRCRAAWSYINMPKNAAMYPLNGVTLSEVKDRIRAALKKYGADVSSDSSSNSNSAARFVEWEPRVFPLEDVHILTRSEGDGSGRVVEAYATVFDVPAEIKDHQGHYTEVIDRGAFDQVLTHHRGAPGGLARAVKVLYNHGKTAEGAPAPEFQVPLGIPLDIRSEARGLLTRTEYDAGDPFTERILGKIRSGAITAQSFVGSIMRSSPELKGPGDRYRARNGSLTTVRRMMLGLREYGPVLWPAYSGAEILGVRMLLPGAEFLEVRMGTPELADSFDSPEDEEYTPEMEGDVTGGAPEDATSARYHQHELYALRSREQREAIGLTW